jgi:RNA-directed DNA polymerase
MNKKTSIISKLKSEFGITSEQLERLVSRAPHAYKTYKIKKKSGGSRTIAQPAKETKLLQDWLIDNVFCDLPISNNATAYKLGSSIKINANRHKNNKYILKMDFKNFFESITLQQIEKHLELNLAANITKDEARAFSKICCIKLSTKNQECLSVGAPSSPVLSNSIMYDFDIEAETWCKQKAITYTRYADDLVFSTNKKNITKEIEEKIKSFISSSTSLTLKFNRKKTIHLSKKYNRTITGLVISNENKVGLGRDRKRAISKQIFLFKNNHLEQGDISQLQGLLGFAKHIDQNFIESLNKKFSHELIRKLLEHRDKKI